MLARLSRPLLHVSKAAWKSLWTISCSAAESSMLNIADKEGESGGLQTEPQLRTWARLVPELLMRVYFAKIKRRNSNFTQRIESPPHFQQLNLTLRKHVWRFQSLTTLSYFLFTFHNPSILPRLRVSANQMTRFSRWLWLPIMLQFLQRASSRSFFTSCKHVYVRSSQCASTETFKLLKTRFL